MKKQIEKNIYYLVEWLGDKSNTWSGTCYGLFEALKLQCNNLQDLDVSLKHSLVVTFINKVSRKIGLSYNGINYGDILKIRKLCKSLLSNKKGDVIQFSEWVYDDENLRTYIYQDLTVPYVKYMSKHDLVGFRYSGFQVYCEKEIEIRYQSQMDYYKHCSGIFTMGKWAAIDLVERCGIPKDKVFHVGGGVNLDTSKIDYSKKEGRRFLFVGRDFERKGGFLVCEAFNKLKRQRPNIELYIAGPKEDPILKHSITGYHFMGDCDHNKLSELFNLCDVFVMPSYFEAYGLVFIEALTYGLPCIGRDAYEMPYFIEEGKTGFLLKNESSSELSKLMSALLDNKGILQNVKDKRSWYVHEYSWKNVANRMLAVVNKKH